MENNMKVYVKTLHNDLSYIMNDIFRKRDVGGALLICIFIGSWLHSFTMPAVYRSYYMDGILPFISFGLLIIAAILTSRLKDLSYISYARVLLLASFILQMIFIAISL